MNIANLIMQNAETYGSKQAVVMRRPAPFWGLGFKKSKFDSCSFDELEKTSALYANALRDIGINRGMKVLTFVTPGLELPSLVFSLFKIGAVPVFIDPGMGVESMLDCIQGVNAQALIGVSKVHYLMKVKRSFFKSVKIAVNVDGAFLGTHALKKITKGRSNQFSIEQMKESELAAILFTSGGTGKPKGVEYTHRMFWDQTLRLKECLRLTPQDKDYPGFPLFSLFTLALGLTSYVAEVDATKPSECNPKKIVRDLIEENISFASGSPIIWQRVAEHCLKKRIAITSVKKLAMFGAPVRYDLLEKLEKVFPQAQLFTPYGATECLPVCLISSYEVLNETKELTLKGNGVCIGYPVRGVEVKIIRNIEGVISKLDETLILPENQFGEIIVKSSTATNGYHNNPEASDLIKVLDQAGNHWHRMGDMGHIDEWGRVWFLGRKSHYLRFDDKDYYPTSIEAIYNEHPEVERSALISVDDKVAVAIERIDKRDSLSLEFQDSFFSELEHLGSKYDITEDIKTFVLFDDFPVDSRHNIKIDRIKLSELAKEKLEVLPQ